jgi:hypothetical protein
MKAKAELVCALFLFMVCLPGFASAQWVVQIGSGNGHSFNAPLKIEQAGQPDLHINAQYETKAFATQAYYYNIKIGNWDGDKAWEIESLHHKVFLMNRPAEVQKFGISHGYNMNMVNRAWKRGKLIYRVGGGFVMTHPETKVRGLQHEDDGGLMGFYLSGLCAQAAVEKRWEINEDWFFSIEGKGTTAWAKVPVARGWATVPITAVHGILAFGYYLK